MHTLELGVRDLRWREEAVGAEGTQEVDPGTEPARRQWVVGPEVIVEGRCAEDHEGLGAFRCRMLHGPSAARLLRDPRCGINRLHRLELGPVEKL